MNNFQECTLSMNIGTSNYLDKNNSITANLPGFEPLFTKLKSNINEIQNLREQQEIDKTGIHDYKEMLRADLAAKAYDISRKTEVFANFATNLILAKEVHYSETALIKATDSKLESRAQIIYDKADDNLSDLLPYGVTEDDLSALQDAISLFHDAVPTTRRGTTEKKQITDQLVILFKDNVAILEKIDLLIEIVRLSQPLFYSGYQDNRKIIHLGTGSLALIASATDAVTSETYKGVKFTFIYQNANEAIVRDVENLVKITSPKGRFNIKNMTEGAYTVIVEKPGLKSKELHIEKADGDMLKLDVKLEKI